VADVGEKDADPVTFPVVVGLTRPPLIYGVPFVVFVVNAMIVVCVFIATSNLLSFLLVFPIHLLLFALVSVDVRIFDIAQIKFGKCSTTRNHAFWGANSYGP
jgi:type IV secretion system protein VirB3